MFGTVNATDGLRIRNAPDGNTIIGLLPFGSKVDILEQKKGFSRIALKTTYTVNGVVIINRALIPVIDGWVSTAYLTIEPEIPIVVPPKPVVPKDFPVGVSLLNNHGQADEFYNKGIRAFLFMDGMSAAASFKDNHPDAVVMVRRWLRSKPLKADWGVFENGFHKGLIYLTPLNEADVMPYGSPAEIEERAKYDGAMFQIAIDHGCTYVGGGFSGGTPGIDNAVIAKAMKDFYRPLWDRGMGLNFHLYSPHPNQPMTEWYELRPEFLFTNCEFKKNGTARIWSDEMGIDTGLAGGDGKQLSGAPSWHMSAQEVGNHTKRFKATIKASKFGDVFAAATWFAASPNEWQSFNISYAVAEIAQAN